MISIFLYTLGLLGDSYYGLAIKNTFLNSFYTTLFQVFSYTRNGIFLAPVFLSMGGLIAKQKSNMNLKVSVTLSVIFLSIMLFEGSFVYNSGLSRHDSMYITLLPCMYFLFHVLLRFNGRKKRPALRDVSLYIYILHPMLIIMIRGGARVFGLSSLFVDNGMIHYFSVCLLSILFSIIIEKSKGIITLLFSRYMLK
jgi:serine/alanine racemase